MPEPCDPDNPAVYHLTAWKAGSTWVRGILQTLEPDRVTVPAQPIADGVEFAPVEHGRIYSPLYISRPRFNESPFARAPHRKFVVIRDLRDTLISWYFSLAKTHDENPAVLQHREALAGLDKESGLLYLAAHPDFYGLTMIASTWMEAGDAVTFRFEALIEDPHRWFRAILTECGMEVPDQRLREVLDTWSFENLAGRPRGTEAVSHYRRGEAGDWRRHFTPAVSWEFGTRFDDLLVKCGYEPTLT